MLEFKFRAYHKPTRVMLSWDNLIGLMEGRTLCAAYPAPDSMPEIVKNLHYSMSSCEIRPCNPFHNPDLIMMQFSGFKDQRDIDIYQGDVVKIRQYNPKLYAVDILDGGFCMTHPSCSPIDINHFNRDGNKMEVLIYTTIHASPEWT